MTDNSQLNIENKNEIIPGLTVVLLDNSGTRNAERSRHTKKFIIDYIDEAKQFRPNERICFISFGTRLHVYGDFSNEFKEKFGEIDEFICSDKIYQLAHKIVETKIQPIGESHRNITGLDDIINDNGGLCTLGRAVLLGFSIIARTGGKIMLFSDGINTHGFDQLSAVNMSRKQLNLRENCIQRQQEGNTETVDFEVYAFDDTVQHLQTIINFAMSEFNSEVHLFEYDRQREQRLQMDDN